MPKGITVKITKQFGQTTVEASNLSIVVQNIVDGGGQVVSILQRSQPDTYEIVFVNSKREEVEVDVPDEIDALDQADGSAN